MVDKLPYIPAKPHLGCGLSKHWGRSCQMMKIFKVLDVVPISAPFARCLILTIHLRTVISYAFFPSHSLCYVRIFFLLEKCKSTCMFVGWEGAVTTHVPGSQGFFFKDSKAELLDFKIIFSVTFFEMWREHFNHFTFLFLKCLQVISCMWELHQNFPWTSPEYFTQKSNYQIKKYFCLLVQSPSLDSLYRLFSHTNSDKKNLLKSTDSCGCDRLFLNPISCRLPVRTSFCKQLPYYTTICWFHLHWHQAAFKESLAS